MQTSKKDRIKAIIWFSFLIIVSIPIIIGKITHKDATETTEINNTIEIDDNNEVEKNNFYNEIKESLSSFNFEYNYNLNDIVNYSGKTYQEETIGYKEDEQGIQKYYLNENNVYLLINNEKMPKGLLTDYDYNKYLSFEYIFEILDGKQLQINDNQVIYVSDNLNITISRENEIIFINITDNSMNISLKYFNINKLHSLD